MEIFSMLPMVNFKSSNCTKFQHCGLQSIKILIKYKFRKILYRKSLNIFYIILCIPIRVCWVIAVVDYKSSSSTKDKNCENYHQK